MIWGFWVRWTYGFYGASFHGVHLTGSLAEEKGSKVSIHEWVVSRNSVTWVHRWKKS